LKEILDENNYNLKYGLQQQALTETTQWILKNAPLNIMFEDRFALLTESINHMEVLDGLVLEFGVYKGSTINHIAKKIDKTKIAYGFDSFEGLKEPWIFGEKGGFSDVNEKQLSWANNIELVKGYFEDTLPSFVKSHSGPISLLHIDSDLYSSCKTIFDCLQDQIVEGTVIVFDEFFNYPNWREGEFKAWNEFLKRNNIVYEFIGFTFQRTTAKKSGNQLAVKILSVNNFKLN
jgi:hypothetical protein